MRGDLAEGGLRGAFMTVSNAFSNRSQASGSSSISGGFGGCLAFMLLGYHRMGVIR